MLSKSFLINIFKEEEKNENAPKNEIEYPRIFPVVSPEYESIINEEENRIIKYIPDIKTHKFNTADKK